MSSQAKVPEGCSGMEKKQLLGDPAEASGAGRGRSEGVLEL